MEDSSFRVCCPVMVLLKLKYFISAIQPNSIIGSLAPQPYGLCLVWQPCLPSVTRKSQHT